MKRFMLNFCYYSKRSFFIDMAERSRALQEPIPMDSAKESRGQIVKLQIELEELKRSTKVMKISFDKSTEEMKTSLVKELKRTTEEIRISFESRISCLTSLIHKKTSLRSEVSPNRGFNNPAFMQSWENDELHEGNAGSAEEICVEIPLDDEQNIG